MKQCLMWMTLLAAEQSEKLVFHVHLSMLSMSVWAEKADFFFFFPCPTQFCIALVN